MSSSHRRRFVHASSGLVALALAVPFAFSGCSHSPPPGRDGGAGAGGHPQDPSRDADAGSAAGDTSGSGDDDGGPITCTAPPPSPDLDAAPLAPAAAMPARPRPLLKPRSKSAAAQPWLDKLTEAQWLALVPRQPPRDPSFGGCKPAGSTGYKWDPLDPDHVTYVDAAGAAVAILPNATDGHTTVSVTVLSGKTVDVPVWTVAGAPCYVQQTIDYEKSQFLFDRLEELAAGYDDPATRKEDFARRIALALDAWSNYLPNYYLTNQNSSTPLPVADAVKKNFTVVQRMSDHNGIGHELDRGVVFALDAIHDSPTLTALSSELGHDVRKKIIDDFFINHVDYLLQRIPITTHVATNLSGTPEQLGNLAIVLGRSDWIEWLNRYMKLTAVHLLRDGMDGESFSYCYGYLTANRATTVEMAGYFDAWPARNDAERAIQQAAAGYNTTIQRGLDAITSVLEPDGTVPPFGNTNFNGNGKARAATRSQILPAYGHLTLGDGAAADQVQVNLNFVDNANHDEEDVATFTLFGAGSELISDLRYARMPGRPFTESSMAHNVVVVDRKTQYRGSNQDTGNAGHLFTGGDLLFWEPNLGGISAAAIDGGRAYPQTVDRYRRLQILNTVDPAHPYLVDLFRVRGGTTHDYFLHGATRFDETAPPPERTTPAATSTLPLALIDKPFPLLTATETWIDPPMNNEPWYGAFRDVWTARSNGGWRATFKATAGPEGHVVHMVDDGDVDVVVGKSPAPFRDKMPDDTKAETFYGYWRPSLIARRTAPAGGVADSLFAAVIEPFGATGPAVTEVARLPLSTDKDLDHVALRVRLAGGREDVVLADLGATVSPVSTADGKFALTGRVGTISRRGGADQRLSLVAGTALVSDGQRLEAALAGHTGNVVQVLRAVEGCNKNAFLVDADLPAGDALAGRLITLTFATYKVIPASNGSLPLGITEQKGIRAPFRIHHVEREGGKTFVVLADDPMLTSAGGAFTETTRPGRRFEGPVTFEITTALTR
jgi:hypothetical protein